jgi:uncharacterized protein
LKRIGLLSDTHGYYDEKINAQLSICDEIWHAGDIGSIELFENYNSIKPCRAVFGNIDGYEIRGKLPEIQRFNCEEVDVIIKHIVGYPGKYDKSILPMIQSDPPKLLIAGHSHLLKIAYDQKNKLLYINPGAAGRSGLHLVRTLVRFTIEASEIKDLEVVELGPRS